MLNRAEWPWLMGGGILAFVLLYCTHQFWRFALRFYTSASS
jgi:ABC-2 type transport system permease protein